MRTMCGGLTPPAGPPLKHLSLPGRRARVNQPSGQSRGVRRDVSA
jgi:hypothetical protein